MAIYKNREVTVMGPTRRVNPPSTIVVQYQDGTHETVPMGQVKFSKEEKDALIKAFPSEYDSVDVASEDDIKAVRVGVAPASDPSYRQQAEGEVRTEEAHKIDEENKRKVKEEVKKDQSKPGAPVEPLTSNAPAVARSTVPVNQNTKVNQQNRTK